MVVEVTLQNSNNYDDYEYGTYSHSSSANFNGHNNGKACWYPGRQRREGKQTNKNKYSAKAVNSNSNVGRVPGGVSNGRGRSSSSNNNNIKNSKQNYRTTTVSTAPGRPSSRGRGRGRRSNGPNTDENMNMKAFNSRYPVTSDTINNAIGGGLGRGDHRGGYRGGGAKAKTKAMGSVAMSVNSIADLSSQYDNESTAYYSEMMANSHAASSTKTGQSSSTDSTPFYGNNSLDRRVPNGASKQQPHFRRQRSPNSIIPEESESVSADDGSRSSKNNNNNRERQEYDEDSSIGIKGGSTRPKKTVDGISSKAGSHLRETSSIAAVETNCAHKQFWTDEMVEGGAFACFESVAKRTRCIPGPGPADSPSNRMNNSSTDDTSSAHNDGAASTAVSATLIPEEFDETNPNNDDAVELNSVVNDDDDGDNLTTIEDRVVPTSGVACTDEQQQWQAAMLQHAMCSDTPATLALASPELVPPGPRRLENNEEEGNFLDDESLTQLEIIPRDDPLLKKQQPNTGYSQVQYISEEPLEVYQDKNALRRAMCTNIKLRKQKQKEKNKENKKGNNTQKQKQKQSLARTEKAKHAPEERPVPLDNSIKEYDQMSNECSVTDLSSVNYPPSLSAERRQQNGGMLPASLIAPWKDCPSSNEIDSNEWIQGGLMASGLLKSQKRRNLRLPQPPTSREEEDALNFYVEVEAMKEQLNGIKDLEDLEKTDGNQGDDEVRGSRVASLVDNDSKFMESVNAKPANQKTMKNEKNQKKGKEQNGKRKGLRLPTCGRGSADDRTYRVSYPPDAAGQPSTRTGQPPASTNRGDELEGGEENVSVPVPLTRTMSQQIAMRALELSGLKQGRSGPSTPSRNSRVSQVSEYDARDGTVLLPANGDVSSMSLNRSGMDLSTSKDKMNRSAEMSIESRSSRHHLNRSSGTESSRRDSYERSNMSLNASRDVGTTNDETGEWRESEIGYYRTHGQSQGNGSEQRYDHQMIGQSWSADSRPLGDLDVPQSPILSQSFESGGENGHVNQSVVSFPDILSSLGAPKFDDNFWQEDDASGLDTNAFEEFDNEQDSIFDDLRSTSNISTPDISSKGSEESERSAGSLDDYLEPPTFDLHDQTMSPERELPKFQEQVYDNSMRYSTTERTERSAVSKSSVASPFAFREEEFVDFDAQMI